MDRKQYDAIKKMMNNPELADEMEETRPGIKAEMAGFLMSPWLPSGITRKLLMAITILAAIVLSIVFENRWFYLLSLILLLFSPRAMGEILSLCGRVRAR